ncbi:oligosaccharide flippase family protein [Paenibacillus sp.]|uniref:oligosaccharide flippase family protein n=1 Tax=Paenibacillus sp. TaxID=58172 RepID=UPI0035614E64
MNPLISLLRRGLDFQSALSFLKGILTRRDSTANSIRTVTVTMLIFLLNLITGIITARYLGPEGKGESSAMLLWPTFFANLLMLGMPSALLYNLKKHPQETASLYITAKLVCLGVGLVGAGTGALLLPSILNSYSSEVVLVSQWLMLTVPVLLIEYTNNATLQAREEFKLFNSLRLLPHLGTLVVLILLLNFHKLDPFTGAFAYALPTVPITILLTLRMVRSYLPEIKKLTFSLKSILHYGIRSAGVDVMGTMYIYMDQVIVILLLNPASLGLYLVALSLSRVVNIIHASLVMVLFPKASELDTEQAIILVKKVFRISSFITCTVAVVFMFIGPFVLSLLYGHQYQPAIAVFRILLFEVVISGGTLILSQAFMSVGKPEISSIQQVIGLFISVLLMVLLVPNYGLLFTGISLLAATCVRFLFVISQYKWVLKTNIPSLLITRDDLNWLFRQIRIREGNTK